MPTRDSAQSTGYKLEWTRWQQMRVTDFLSWQAALVRKYRRPDQFVTTGLCRRHEAGCERRGCRKSLDIAAINDYHGTQDHYDGVTAGAGRGLHPLAETEQLSRDGNECADHGLDFGLPVPTLRWSAAEDVYTHIANGADMVEYWHWAFDHCEPGNLLEGRPFARLRTQSCLRRGLPDGP